MHILVLTLAGSQEIIHHVLIGVELERFKLVSGRGTTFIYYTSLRNKISGELHSGVYVSTFSPRFPYKPPSFPPTTTPFEIAKRFCGMPAETKID